MKLIWKNSGDKQLICLHGCCHTCTDPENSGGGGEVHKGLDGPPKGSNCFSRGFCTRIFKETRYSRLLFSMGGPDPLFPLDIHIFLFTNPREYANRLNDSYSSDFQPSWLLVILCKDNGKKS